MLDSDVGNSILPHVRFYQKEVKHEFNTEKEGRPIYYMADFVRIEIPGNTFSIIDTFSHEGHKQQFPQQWARYQNEKKDLGDDVTGTMLSDWSILTAAQVRELKHYHFYTVEQVALASDAQINTITPIVGMSGFAFREKAQNYLKHAKDSAIVDAQSEELRKRDAEIEALKAQMNELMAAANEKKRGRPAKEPENESN
ncbi:MAG: hypothetical protein PHT07_20700 [Paludibacter sp.]|nr:hypothetical protein [Paludibacter sp.]